MQKFELQPIPYLRYLNYLIISLSLLALYFWRAPLPYRLSAISLTLLLAIFYIGFFQRKQQPKLMHLTFKNEQWHLNEQWVKLHPASLLNPHYSALRLQTIKRKNHYLMITHQSFKDQTEYNDFIRFVKTHRGSF